MTYCPETGKVVYESKSRALEARERIKNRRRKTDSKRRIWERDPYRCRHCGLWHLTSTSPA
jgi:hypothetical protein